MSGVRYASGEPFRHEQFLDRTMGFVDRLVGERRGTGIRVRDRHAAEPLPPGDVRSILGRDVGIGQRVVRVTTIR